MERRDLTAALHFLDRIACPRIDPNRLAVERILLRLLADVEEAEQIVAILRGCGSHGRLVN